MRIFWFCIGLLLATMLIMANAGNGAEVRVSWQPNKEADLAGYRVYYGAGDAEDAKVIAETGKDATEAVVTVPDGPAVFYLTAFDLTGHESDPSEPTYLDADAPPAPPVIIRVEMIVQLYPGGN